MIKDTDEHPDGRDAQGKVCGKGCGTSVPSLGVPFSPRLRLFTSLEALQIPYYWDFMEASSYRHKQFLTPFPAPLLSLGGGVEKFQASHHGLVFLVTSSHLIT